eukprot:scaffold12986_cov67-Skeletonema_menzelii.AAC.1
MNTLETKRGERTNDVCETQNRADTDLVERSDVLGSSCIMKWKGQMYSAVTASWSDLLMELLQSDNSGKIPKFPLVAIADSLKMGDDAKAYQLFLERTVSRRLRCIVLLINTL